MDDKELRWCCPVAKSCPTFCNPMNCSISWILLNLMSIELVMLSNQLILCHLLPFLLSIFPVIRLFSDESVPHVMWPRNWAWATALGLPVIFRVDILQDWLVWSPCCPRDSQEYSPAPQFTPAPQLKDISSLALRLLYGPTLTSIHDYWEKP